MRISIDGPAGAGKTTMARALARALGFTYVDTGGMYRALALYLERNGKPVDEAVSCLPDVDVSLGGDAIYLNGEDVTPYIRTGSISMLSSTVSKLPEVREFMVQRQREIAMSHDVVMEGRDIGSVVLPDAEVKFYLTADLLARAERRYQQSREKNEDVDPVALAAEMQKRDEQDMTREHSPLVVPAGAVLIDNTNMSPDSVLRTMIQVAAARQADANGPEG